MDFLYLFVFTKLSIILINAYFFHSTPYKFIFSDIINWKRINSVDVDYATF